jgi:hypothetical protein
MNTENINPKQKFAVEGVLHADASSLDCTVTAVYYGFNCSPRQVRYYKLDKSVESILQGGYTRSSIVNFLFKVKEKMQKAELKHAEYKEKAEGVRLKQNTSTDSLTRQVLRKEACRIETKMYNYEYEVLGKYQRAVESLRKFLEE